MELLNSNYVQYCKPGYSKYIKKPNDIFLIDNFFVDFEKARNFFINRDKWKCISYQNHSKPGYESIFPSWIGNSLLEKYILDNKIIDDANSYEVVCNFFYYDFSYVWSLSNSFSYPHIDAVPTDNILKYICLVNLNSFPVSTNFYSYKNQESCSYELKHDWEKYSDKIKNHIISFYERTNITKKDIESYLNIIDLDIKFLYKIDFKPNQSIIYPANLFHSPNITEDFTEKNPRALLRISYDQKIISKKNFNDLHFLYK